VVYIDLQSSSTFFKDVQLNLFFALLEVVFYLLMFTLVVLEKFDMLANNEMGEAGQGESGKTDFKEDLN
jgi:hypothetical protein